jgi:hypothetical protein
MIDAKTTIHSHDKAAAEILQLVIQKSTGVRLPIVNNIRENQINIVANHTDSDYYDIDGNTIMYGGDMAVAAVGNFCEKHFGAYWIWPSKSGLFVQPKTLPIKTRYKTEFLRDYIMRVERRLTGVHAEYVLWHHCPSRVDETNFHKTWFRGLALKYPQLARPNVRIKEDSSIDLLHPDAPAAIEEKWIELGSPPVVSLFPPDGNDDWWCANQYDYSGLSKGDEDWMRKAITQALYPQLLPKGSPEVQAWFAKNVAWNKASESGKSRISNLHIYLDAYKKIEYYFKQKGHKVRFRILAYSSYYFAKNGLKFPDLNNFDVYYCSPQAGALDYTTQDVRADLQNLRRWQKSNCKFAWRPNFFQHNALPVQRQHTIAPFLTQLVGKYRGGAFITSYYLPGVSPLTWYITMRLMYSKKKRTAIANEFYRFCPEATPWVESAQKQQYFSLPKTANEYLDTLSELAKTNDEKAWETALEKFPQIAPSMTQIRQALSRKPDEEF